ncbi:hypothetical protein J6590_053967 [Homalodisca vitripennis]|nr:hypothetical protein J6590_053967 [Homalodisca vitripennis]
MYRSRADAEGRVSRPDHVLRTEVPGLGTGESRRSGNRCRYTPHSGVRWPRPPRCEEFASSSTACLQFDLRLFLHCFKIPHNQLKPKG